jgi:hypothetical protein
MKRLKLRLSFFLFAYICFYLSLVFAVGTAQYDRTQKMYEIADQAGYVYVIEASRRSNSASLESYIRSYANKIGVEKINSIELEMIGRQVLIMTHQMYATTYSPGGLRDYNIVQSELIRQGFSIGSIVDQLDTLHRLKENPQQWVGHLERMQPGLAKEILLSSNYVYPFKGENSEAEIIAERRLLNFVLSDFTGQHDLVVWLANQRYSTILERHMDFFPKILEEVSKLRLDGNGYCQVHQFLQTNFDHSGYFSDELRESNVNGYKSSIPFISKLQQVPLELKDFKCRIVGVGTETIQAKIEKQKELQKKILNPPNRISGDSFRKITEDVRKTNAIVPRKLCDTSFFARKTAEIPIAVLLQGHHAGFRDDNYCTYTINTWPMGNGEIKVRVFVKGPMRYFSETFLSNSASLRIDLQRLDLNK